MTQVLIIFSTFYRGHAEGETEIVVQEILENDQRRVLLRVEDSGQESRGISKKGF